MDYGFKRRDSDEFRDTALGFIFLWLAHHASDNCPENATDRRHPEALSDHHPEEMDGLIIQPKKTDDEYYREPYR